MKKSTNALTYLLVFALANPALGQTPSSASSQNGYQTTLYLKQDIAEKFRSHDSLFCSTLNPEYPQAVTHVRGLAYNMQEKAWQPAGPVKLYNLNPFDQQTDYLLKDVVTSPTPDERLHLSFYAQANLRVPYVVTHMDEIVEVGKAQAGCLARMAEDLRAGVTTLNPTQLVDKALLARSQVLERLQVNRPRYWLLLSALPLAIMASTFGADGAISARLLSQKKLALKSMVETYSPGQGIFDYSPTQAKQITQELRAQTGQMIGSVLLSAVSAATLTYVMYRSFEKRKVIDPHYEVAKPILDLLYVQYDEPTLRRYLQAQPEHAWRLIQFESMTRNPNQGFAVEPS